MASYTPETRQRVVNLAIEGLTDDAVSTATGVPEKLVAIWRRKAGIHRGHGGDRTQPPAPIAPVTLRTSRPCVETDAYGHVVNQEGKW